MTKLRFVLGDKEDRYLKRLSDYISFRYGDRIELYTFTEKQLLESFLTENKVNGVFAGKGFLEVREHITPTTCFAYLSEGIETENYENIVMLVKYQNADALVKEMIALCSEQVAEVYQGKNTDGRGKIILFESPLGGVGTTLAAAACAYYFAGHGKKALYMNLEEFGSVKGIFQGEGRFDFRDIIYALKSRKVNLHLKIESIIREDSTGVFYIEPCSQPVDLQSFTEEEAKHFLKILLEEGGYDAVIIDRNSRLDSMSYVLREIADEIVLVTVEERIQNDKLQKFIHAIKLTEEKMQLEICNKLQILYNGYDARSAFRADKTLIPALGRLPKIEGIAEKQMIERFAAEDVFRKLL